MATLFSFHYALPMSQYSLDSTITTKIDVQSELQSTMVKIDPPQLDESKKSNAYFDERLQTWVYIDPTTGSKFEWNQSAQSYVPMIDYEQLAKQQSAYISSSMSKPKTSKSNKMISSVETQNETISLLDLATSNRSVKDYGESRIIEDTDGTKYVQKKVNKAIYVTGLPTDITEEEFVSFFSKAGILKKDPETGKVVIKLYKDDQGKPKGDALVTYWRPESIANAFTLLHESEIRPGFKISIEPAKFKVDENTEIKTGRRRGKRKRPQSQSITNSSARNANGDDHENEKDNQHQSLLDDLEGSDDDDLDVTAIGDQPKGGPSSPAASTQPKLKTVARKKKKMFDQSKELSWEETEQKHVILKNMFKPEKAVGDLNYYDDLKEEILQEAQKLGHVESIKVFERNPQGVVAIKFATGSAAEKCITVMHGRSFDRQKIVAEFYDGFSDYYVPEKEDEVEHRDKNWEKWLQDS